MDMNNHGNNNQNVRNRPLGYDQNTQGNYMNQGNIGENQPCQNNYQQQQSYNQQQYFQQSPQYYQQPQQQDVLCTLALVLSIISMVCCFISPLISIPALIMAVISIVKTTSQSKTKQIIAIVLAILSLCAFSIFIIIPNSKETNDKSLNTKVETKEETQKDNSEDFTKVEIQEETQKNSIEDSKNEETQVEIYEDSNDNHTNEDVMELVYDNNDIKIYYTGTSESFLGFRLNFYAENNSSNNIMISCDRTSVNGFEIGSYMGLSIGKGLKAYDSIFLSDSNLEEAHMTQDDIEDIVVDLHMFDSDKFNNIDDFSFTISIE